MNDSLQKKLSEITSLKTKMDGYRPLSKAEVALLDKNIRIEHVWSSNAIEGSSLTKYETASILNTGMTIHGKSVSETLDALDLSVAYDYMTELATNKTPLSATIVRDLNRLVTSGVHNQQAGQYRVVDAWPYGLEGRPYPGPFEINPLMNDFIKWSQEKYNQLHPVVYAAEVHQRFVSIHPFADGNGRTARLLMNMSLTQNGYPVINIQPNKESRENYMMALEISRSTDNKEPFIGLIADEVRATLQDRIEILSLAEKNQKQAAQETNLRRKEISDNQGLSR